MWFGPSVDGLCAGAVGTPGHTQGVPTTGHGFSKGSGLWGQDLWIFTIPDGRIPNGGAYGGGA